MEHENGDDAADNTDAADNSSVAPSAVSGSRPIPESSATGQGIHRNASDLLDAVAHLEERNVVLCVGLMRTGLKTLHKALRNMGYSKIYDQEDIVSTYELWDDVLRNKATKATYAQIFKDSEVIMGMPTFCFWEQIVELYPGAQVILTVRNEDEWWESVQRAKTLMDKDLPGAPLQYGSVMKYLESLLMPSYHKFCEVLRFSWAATLGAQALEGRELNEVAARGSYRRHNQYVQALLADHTTPSGRPRLLVYDVREGWDRLAEFLGSDKPQVEFPSAMEVPYFPGHHEGGSEKTKRTREEKPARLVDGGQELEALWSPDSDLGGRMRKELRRGLALFFAAFACILAVVVVMLRLTRIAQLPLAFFVILYLAIATIGWNAYVVVHGLVMRVPALVVLPMALKSLLIASCLHICFISYGILKEKLVTQDHIASPLLVCASRLIAVVLGASILLVTEGRIMLGAPMQSLLAFVCTNEASTWAGYEMLRYVSFPVQVMAKSCKLFPNMVMGRILHKQRYEPQQYVQAIAALVCVIIMHMSDETDQNALGGSSSSSHSSLGNAFMGVLFLSFFFVCDSFTSQWQTRLYKQHPTLTQNQLMFGGNLLGLVLTTGTLFFNREIISTSGRKLYEHPEVLQRVLALGLSGALGQFCIYSAIRTLGPISFAWIMTARQLLSVLISLVFFGHGISAVKLLCIITVFGIISSRQLRRAIPKNMQCSKRNLYESRRSGNRSSVGSVGTISAPFSKLSHRDWEASASSKVSFKKDQ